MVDAVVCSGTCFTSRRGRYWTRRSESDPPDVRNLTLADTLGPSAPHPSAAIEDAALELLADLLGKDAWMDPDGTPRDPSAGIFFAEDPPAGED